MKYLVHLGLLYSGQPKPAHVQDNTIILSFFLVGIAFLNTRGSVSIQKEASSVAVTWGGYSWERAAHFSQSLCRSPQGLLISALRLQCFWSAENSPNLSPHCPYWQSNPFVRLMLVTFYELHLWFQTEPGTHKEKFSKSLTYWSREHQDQS